MASPNLNSDLDQDTIAVDTGAGPGERMSQKRPAWDSNNDRASKRRASKACLSCRNRKVRCDVVSGGHPCTNCKLDKIDCVVKESNRGRKPGATASQAALESPPANETAVNLASPPVDPSLMAGTPPASPLQRNQTNDYLVSLSFEDQQGLPPTEEVADEIRVHVRAERNPENQNNTSSKQPDSSGPRPGPQTIPIEPGSSTDLPPYILPLPRHLDSRDIQYLADKDALTIPDDSFRDELLRIYVYIVYPFMPAIDLEDFLLPIVRGDGHKGVSLLLFQAVMFASVTFVDAEILQARGYKNRKAARKDFFNRVRLLYGLDCEPDRLPLLQAVLLMTYWYDCPADDKDTWYWMGIALSLAQVVGFHREPEPLKTPMKMRKLRRRIWWSCVMRDRLLALGIRRPSRIRDEEFGVPPLTLEDFDLQTPTEAIVGLLGESRLTGPGPSARSEMAVMCVELSRLCVCLGHVLHSQYSLMGNQHAASDFLVRATVLPKQTDTQLQDLASCDAELNEWLSNQDHRSKYTPPTRGSDDGDDEATRIIRLHQALLQMIYLTSIGVLHKPQVFYSGCDGVDGPRKAVSREKVTEAAVAITKLAFHLQDSNQLRYLSTSSIPAFLSASLIHLMDVRSSDEEVRNISIGRFYQCVHALQQLQDMYGSADYAVKFIEAVLRNTDIVIPMMRPTFFLPKGNQPKSHASRFSRWTSHCIASGRVGTAYPSPSSSRNHQIGPEPTSEDASNSFEPDIPVPSTPFNAQLTAWPTGTHDQDGSNQESVDAIPDPSFMGDWIDIDNLVPALINFEADNNMMISTNVAFM